MALVGVFCDCVQSFVTCRVVCQPSVWVRQSFVLGESCGVVLHQSVMLLVEIKLSVCRIISLRCFSEPFLAGVCEPVMQVQVCAFGLQWLLSHSVAFAGSGCAASVDPSAVLFKLFLCLCFLLRSLP